VRKIKEALRLKYDVGLGLRQIARSCAIGLGTAHEYLQRAEAAKITWPLGPEWDDDRLEAALFGGPPRSRPAVLPMPDFADLHRQRQQHSHVTQQLLWEEYRQANPDGYQYSRFCELYQRWRRKQDVVLRQEHKAGEKLFVDWAGTTIPIHDPRGGPVRQAHLFVAVLGASSYTYADATPDEQLASWIGAHVRAFEFYQGVPKLVVPDNTKTGVTKACRYDPDLNPTYQDGHALRRRSGSGAAIQASGQHLRPWTNGCGQELRGVRIGAEGMPRRVRCALHSCTVAVS
jgi:transposase